MDRQVFASKQAGAESQDPQAIADGQSMTTAIVIRRWGR